MDRYTLMRLWLALLLISVLVEGINLATASRENANGSGASDPYAAVRPYAEQALALATMEYGLALMAVPMPSASVNFGNFELDRHTVTWLGLLGVELSPSLPPHGTVTTLRSGDDDGDGAPWAVRSYALSGSFLGGGSFELAGAAGLGELTGDDDPSLMSYAFDPAAEGGPLTLEVTDPGLGTVAKWSIADFTASAWAQSPDAVEYRPDLHVELEREGATLGHVAINRPSDAPPLLATLEFDESSFADSRFRVSLLGTLTFQVSSPGVSYGPVELTPVVPANDSLALSTACLEGGMATAGFVSGKVYYVDASGKAVATVTIAGCGQYEVQTFF